MKPMQFILEHPQVRAWLSLLPSRRPAAATTEDTFPPLGGSRFESVRIGAMFPSHKMGFAFSLNSVVAAVM